MTHRVGMRRQIDPLGRIVVPADLRRALGWGVGQELEFVVSGHGEVTLRSVPVSACVFCGSLKDVVPHFDRYVCVTCVEKIAKLLSL